jgi:hypothetical protein
MTHKPSHMAARGLFSLTLAVSEASKFALEVGGRMRAGVVVLVVLRQQQSSPITLTSPPGRRFATATLPALALLAGEG